MISTSQREHLTYTLIGQTLTLFAIGLISFRYILPGFSQISVALAETEKAIISFKEAQEGGYSYERMTAILSEMGNKEELLKIIQATPEQTRAALQKEGTTEYLSWLKNAINASDEDKKKLIQAKKKINSILPTLSPISANIDEENINLKQYIKFIEGRIINKFDFGSNITLGIQGLSLGNAGNKMPNNIGTFDLRLDFKTSNKKIQEFIDFVKDSGNTEILTQSGILSEDQIPEIMSNPLITMESLSLQESLDVKNNPDQENSGRATIRFYLRGGSKEDITYLRENLRTRKIDFGNKVAESVTSCKENESFCIRPLDKLLSFQVKYNEFIKSVGGEGTEGGAGINDIYSLSQQVVSLRALEAEFDSFNGKITQ